MRGREKGCIPWNKGLKGVCKPNSGSFKKGHTSNSTSFKKGNIPWITGRKHSEETRKKMSLKASHIAWNKGLKNWMSPNGLESMRAIKKIQRATQILPVKDTSIERKIHELLDELHIKYKKHYPVYHSLMGYHQVDVMLLDHEDNPKLAIECDGCFWHGCSTHCTNVDNYNYILKTVERDKLIDRCMQEMGIKLIRLWEHDIRKNNIKLEEVLQSS